jgi:hypothetical protein
MQKTSLNTEISDTKKIISSNMPYKIVDSKLKILKALSCDNKDNIIPEMPQFNFKTIFSFIKEFR